MRTFKNRDLNKSNSFLGKPAAFKKSSLGKKISKMSVGFTVFTTLTIIVLNTVFFINQSILGAANAAKSVADAVSLAIDGEKFGETMKNLAPDEFWRETRDYAKSVREKANARLLYLVGADYGDEVTYFTDLSAAPTDDEYEALGKKESVGVYHESFFGTLDSGISSVSEVYDSKDSEDAMTDRWLVAGNSAIKDGDKVVGAVGVEFTAGALILNAFRAGAGVLALGIALCCLAAVAVSRYCRKKITAPIASVLNYSKSISKGDFEGEIYYKSGDEIEELFISMGELKSAILSIINEIDDMSESFLKGDIAKRINAKNFKGKFAEAARKINETVSGITDDLNEVIDYSGKLAKGDFNFKIKEYPGEKKALTDKIGLVVFNLRKIKEEIKKLIAAGAEGNLDWRIQTEDYSGEWKEICVGLNNMLSEIAAPMREVESVIIGLSEGNLKVGVQGDYKGEFNLLKERINFSLKTLAFYINEIKSALDKVASKDFTDEIESDFLGDFNEIKNAVNSIIQTYNLIMLQINESATRIGEHSKFVYSASASLAEGATAQSAAVREINFSLETIIKRLRQSAENLEDSSGLADNAKNSANEGAVEMLGMLRSMEEISKASTDISEIIKLVDGIASQTNSLSLNASTEAARVGEEGKGFTVVAEEIRSLALRSKDAAKKTSVLLDSALEKVSEGMDTANNTNRYLKEIVSKINGIAALLEAINASSASQAESMNQIGSGISQISKVAQTNAQKSEEQAGVSQRLFSESEMFLQMAREFKLRK
jgi:methyl-accepting chemotaxis protein